MVTHRPTPVVGAGARPTPRLSAISTISRKDGGAATRGRLVDRALGHTPRDEPPARRPRSRAFIKNGREKGASWSSAPVASATDQPGEHRLGGGSFGQLVRWREAAVAAVRSCRRGTSTIAFARPKHPTSSTRAPVTRRRRGPSHESPFTAHSRSSISSTNPSYSPRASLGFRHASNNSAH